MGDKHVVRFEPVGIEIEVGEEQTILRAAFEQGVMLMHGCKEGQCSSCKSFVLDGDDIELDRGQIDAEKDRVYASVKRDNGIGWKEFKAGCARVMQDHCSAYKCETVLNEGLKWFASIREQEMEQLVARNPHELMRVNECYSQVTCSELTLHNSLARKASTAKFDFKRTDYPQVDPPEWNVFVTVTMDAEGNYVTGTKPLDYYLQEPYSQVFRENYDLFACLDEYLT